MIRKILLATAAILFVLIAVIFVRTLTLPSKQISVQARPAPRFNDEALSHFKNAISYKTVSYGNPALFDSSAFIGFRKFLEHTYPVAHKTLKREIVAGYTLFYTWTGSDTTLSPIVLMAHQDVVPVEEGTESIWTVDPFLAVVKDDFVWGRGAADDKINLISIMESVEKLLEQGFTPRRTIYLIFGHDEEVGGTGAQACAALMKSRNIYAEMVLDEGGIITREKIPGMKGLNVALIGTSEKGAMSLELRVEQHGGHSAMPAAETAIDILARAVTRLREKPFDAQFSPSTEGFAEYLGPEMPFSQRMAFANLWLFRPVVYGLYEKSSEGNAMIRTTIAPTIIQSGIKDNVIPTLATATVNFRMLPGDSSAAVIRRVNQVIGDSRVVVSLKGDAREGTSVTSPNSFAYMKLDSTIRKSFDSIVTAPFLMIAATDSRYMSGVSDGIVKFSPMIDPIGFHGIDERVSLESFSHSLWFFEQLILGL